MAKKELTAKEIIDLKERVQRLRVEAAKHEERREQAIRTRDEAQKTLKELGILPVENAALILQTAYEEIVEEVESLEERLGIA